MILALLFAVQAVPPPADPLQTEDPPTEMIDFLGRRRACIDQASPDGGAPFWLRCADLPAEESDWRRRSAGNATALRWLDQDPVLFHLNSIGVSAFDGPHAALPKRIEQSGTDRSGHPYHLIIDTEANGGQSTRFTGSFANVAPRTFTVDNGVIPFLDLQSLEVMVGTPPEPGGQLYLMLRYGYPRGYCQEGEVNDRPELSIVFDPNRVRGYLRDRTNCQVAEIDLTDADAPR